MYDSYNSSDKIVGAMYGAHRVLSHPKMIDSESGMPYRPISMDDLYTVVSEISGFDIEMRDVNFEAKYLHGRIEIYDGKRAKIDVRAGLNEADKRFVTAKELMHLVIDANEDYCPYGDQIIDELIDRGLVGKYNLVPEVSRPAASDVITEIAATEVLFPLSFRMEEMARVRNPNDPTSYVKLATEYEVPNDCVSRALSEQYLAECGKAIDEVMAKFEKSE